MGENTAIEWADHTFNPWIGCTKVSPACDNCYAEKLAVNRLGVAWGPHAERRRTAESTWRQPLAWNRKAQREGKRARVFCASLADVFDNQVPAEWRNDLWDLIKRTEHLDWLLLTKRPQNIRKMILDLPAGHWAEWGAGWPNVWLGTTVENQAEADRRIPHLLAVPAARRFLSCEPLLGPVALHHIRMETKAGTGFADALRGEFYLPGCGSVSSQTFTRQPRIDWVIAGGESGPGARPLRIEWARSLRDQCAAAGVPFLWKQWGEFRPDDPGGGQTSMVRVGKKAAGRLLDGVQHDAVPHV
jgi:protein gp37